jgi:hypothetical protein
MKCIINILVVLLIATGLLATATSAAISAANIDKDEKFYGIFYAGLVAAGQIESDGRATSNHCNYSFKIAEVLKGKPPGEETIDIVTRWANPCPLKKGDNLILVLNPPSKNWPGWWLSYGDNNSIQTVTPQAIASIKRIIVDGPAPPFNKWRTWRVGVPQPSPLDLRISALANSITTVPKQLHNGKADVMELPIRIENKSNQTVAANITHEWYGGVWGSTDLGVAVRRADDEPGNWRMSPVFLSGELGGEDAPTIWQPGQSHDFVLRMNWPGTGSQPSVPLIAANTTGEYLVRVSLVFEVKGNLQPVTAAAPILQYVASAPMKIEVTKHYWPF